MLGRLVAFDSALYMHVGRDKNRDGKTFDFPKLGKFRGCVCVDTHRDQVFTDKLHDTFIHEDSAFHAQARWTPLGAEIQH